MRIVALFCYVILLLPPLAAQANPHVFSFPANELSRAEDAIAAIRKNRPEEAIAIASKLKNATIRQTVEWAIYKSPGSPVSADTILAFAKNHPDWPEQDALTLRAEEVFLKNNKDTNATIAYFEKNPPQTAAGKWKLAEAYLLKNAQNSKAGELLKDAWHSAQLGSEDSDTIRSKYKTLLSKEDFSKRISNLLWENKITLARSLLNHVTKDQQRLFEARIALQQSSYGVDSAVAAVPSSLKNDPGFVYDRIRWREKKDLTSGALDLMKTVQDTGKQAHSKQWWNMRKRLIRDALERKQYQSAYDIANHHNAEEGGIEFAESEWLAGWIAARFLRDPRTGYEHFYKMYHHVSYPISLARASFWAGTTAHTNGNADIAKNWFKLAAKYPFTFYGQLAIAELSKKPELPLPERTSFSKKDEKEYKESDVIKAIHALIQMDEFDLAKNFTVHAVRHYKSEGMRTLISQIGQSYKQAHLSVYAARTADQEGTPIVQSGYPLLPVDYTIHTMRELAHGITLQESRFDTKAESHAGALGLMQLMPATARRMAKSLHVNYRKSKLVYKPDYNVSLGSHYLKLLLEAYDGYPILAIAAYNAGPGNVRKWIATYGDPRHFETIEQVVDWIELIPFAETRNYVQRVLENMQIYRRLSGEKELRIEKDLISTH